MITLRAYLAKELPPVNAFIQGEVEKLHPVVRPAASHAFQSGGKRLRPLLTLLTARALGVSPEIDLYPLACSLEFIHTATLLHDDILDQAEFRRGLPAAHTVYGLTETILAGDVLLGLANRLVADYGDARLTGIVAEAVMRTAVGEILEIAQAKRQTFTLDAYLEIISGKTAFLLQAACQCGAVVAGADAETERAFSSFGLNLGVAFQLVDDALDYSSDAATSGKPRGGDLREGKFTLPLILYLESLDAEERRRLESRIVEHALDEDEALRVSDGIVDGGFAEKTRQAAEEYLDKARTDLAAAPASPEKDALGETLEFIVKRSK